MIIENYEELEKILDSKQNICSFLCGNGFSMNFDNEFSDMYSRLENAHKILIRDVEIDVIANTTFKRKLLDNYKNVVSWLRYATQNKIEKIFYHGIEFAKSIIDNKELIEELKVNNKISKLTFGLENLDLVKMICENGTKYGIYGVNIEHWSILVYFYYSILDLDTEAYGFPEENEFVNIVKIGDRNKSDINGLTDANINTIFNGFSTYYRFLFSVAIFAEGKSIDLAKLNKKYEININSIEKFLSKFVNLTTLNYDSILEMITGRYVEHLHGKFILNDKLYVYYQNYTLKYMGKSIDFSNILIGDYFVFKTFLGVINNMASKYGANIKLESYHIQIKRIISENSINTFFLFGMNIENDYHIMRNLMLELFFAKAENPKIIYCYFDEKQKEIFIEQYDKMITFNEEASEYAHGIELIFIKTDIILKKVFLK